MKEKVINIAAWIALVLWSIGLIFKPLHFPGASSALIFGGVISQFLVIPLFFFFKNKRIDQNYRGRWVKTMQGVFFLIAGFVSLFNIQHYPGSGLFNLLSPYLLLLILLSLTMVKTVRIRNPQVFSLLIIIYLNAVSAIIINKLEDYHWSTNSAESYKRIKSINSNLYHELAIHENWQKIELSKNAKPLLDRIDSIQVELIRASTQLPSETVDSLFKKNFIPDDLGNRDLSAAIMIGPDHNHPFEPNHRFSALGLKALWQPFVESRINNYPDSISSLSSFSFSGIMVDDYMENWETSEFFHFPVGDVLTKLESYRHFIYMELLIELNTLNDNQNLEYNRLKRQQVFQLFKSADLNPRSTYKSLQAKNESFLIMLALTTLATLLLFLVPTFGISEVWKMRYILFIVVIVFEFFLLLTDLFLGTFSQNPIYMLGANILLALGLVTLDGYLRNNFLKWFEEKTHTNSR